MYVFMRLIGKYTEPFAQHFTHIFVDIRRVFLVPVLKPC